MEHQNDNQDQPPLKRRRRHSAPSTMQHFKMFEVDVSDARKEIVLLLSQQADYLRSSAAADTAQMKDAEELLFEVKNLEITLRNKKKHLLAQLDIITARLMNHF